MQRAQPRNPDLSPPLTPHPSSPTPAPTNLCTHGPLRPRPPRPPLRQALGSAARSGWRRLTLTLTLTLTPNPNPNANPNLNPNPNPQGVADGVWGLAISPVSPPLPCILSLPCVLSRYIPRGEGEARDSP